MSTNQPNPPIFRQTKQIIKQLLPDGAKQIYYLRKRQLHRARLEEQGCSYGETLSIAREQAVSTEALSLGENPLQAFFHKYTEGRGIHKWTHYLEIYHSHFQRFIGKNLHILEVGVSGGGSLEMWKQYFGPQCMIYGVDIIEHCKSFETDSQRIFIGDQSDRDFWAKFKSETPALDIIIDDGSHQWDHQIVTFEEMFPRLKPGGIYVCEDIHGNTNEFIDFVNGFTRNLHTWNYKPEEQELTSAAHKFQSIVKSVHQYPFMVVIETRGEALSEFVSARRGTLWSKPNNA